MNDYGFFWKLDWALNGRFLRRKIPLADGRLDESVAR